MIERSHKKLESEKIRKQILKNGKEAKAEEKAGRLIFSSDMNFLKKQLNIK